jgi:hypothetical protein
MLRTAFLGNCNAFNMLLTDWLAQRTDLRVVIWGAADYWANSWRGRARFFWRRAKRYSIFKALDEILFYAFYRFFLQERDAFYMNRMIKAYREENDVVPSGTPFYVMRVRDVNTPEVREALVSEGVDVMFVDCLDAYVKPFIFEAPRLGTYLWHEGFTPEYRGFHCPLYTIINKELDKLGSTFLKMDRGFDTGPIVVQTPVRDVDPLTEPYGYIAHKGILDSLPVVGKLIGDLEAGRPLPRVDREGAPSRIYTRPGITDYIRFRLAVRRLKREARTENIPE